jgi:hypothetical protein
MTSLFLLMKKRIILCATIKVIRMNDVIRPAVYFPYIHFQNLNWLKTAALFYNQICRVIPNGYLFHDDDVVKALTKETDLIKIHHPTNSEAEIIGARFVRACESGIIDTLALGGGETAHVHRDKLSFFLEQYLQAQNLAREQSRGDQWFAMSGNAAAVYMGFLANEYAKELRGSVVSDESRMVAALNVIQADAADLRNAPTEQIVYATFKRLKLRNPGLVDVRNIIAFRTKYRGERIRFFSEIEKLAQEIPISATNGDIGAFLNEKARILEEALTDMRKAAQSVGITTASGACSALFAGTLRGGTDLPHLLSSVVGGAGIGLLFGAINQFRKQRSSPVAYLDRIQRTPAFASR